MELAASRAGRPGSLRALRRAVTFNPSSRVRDVGDYFLYDRELDVDSFLKSTVGYSLQVAAIALFFLWTFSYGLWTLIVCFAWGSGYWIVARLLQKGQFDSFLGTARSAKNPGDPKVIATIHGYIQSRLGEYPEMVKRVTILVISLASVIGLGGTMLTEIFYGTSFFTTAIGIATPSLALETIIHLFILFFALLYVLWGGYRASVFIDRFQTPIAYVAFGLFAIGLAVFTTTSTTRPSAFWVVGSLLVIFTCLLLGRSYLLRQTMPDVLWNKAITYLTFAPLAFLSLACLLFLWPAHLHWLIGWLLVIFTLYLLGRNHLLRRAMPLTFWKKAITYLTFASLAFLSLACLLYLWPPHSGLRSMIGSSGNSLMGFGVLGVISLALTNGIWQLIDISSLQRLQSLNVNEVKQHQTNVVKAFRWIGTEAALGWTIIVAAALLLKIEGFSITNDQVTTFLSKVFHEVGTFSFLLPVFIFTVVVFMVSTVSCFISALSYIARYDIAPALKLIPEGGQTIGAQEMTIARLTTLMVVAFLYAFYAVLVGGIGHDNVATVLYAVYAFQVAITPSVLTALFLRKRPVNAWAAIASTVVGMGVAWYTAMQPAPPNSLGFVGNESWYVIPPFAAILASCIMYLLVFGGAELRTRLLRNTA